jgi:hypothetical protein
LRSSLKWIRLAAVDAEPKGPNSNPEPYVPNSIDRVIVVAIALGSFAWGIRSGFRTAEFATDHRGDQDAGRFAAPKSARAAAQAAAPEAPAAGVRIPPALRSSLLRKASRGPIIEKPTNSKLVLSTKVKALDVAISTGECRCAG